MYKPIKLSYGYPFTKSISFAHYGKKDDDHIKYNRKGYDDYEMGGNGKNGGYDDKNSKERYDDKNGRYYDDKGRHSGYGGHEGKGKMFKEKTIWKPTKDYYGKGDYMKHGVDTYSGEDDDYTSSWYGGRGDDSIGSWYRKSHWNKYRKLGSWYSRKSYKSYPYKPYNSYLSSYSYKPWYSKHGSYGSIKKPWYRISRPYFGYKSYPYKSLSPGYGYSSSSSFTSGGYYDAANLVDLKSSDDYGYGGHWGYGSKLNNLYGWKKWSTIPIKNKLSYSY